MKKVMYKLLTAVDGQLDCLERCCIIYKKMRSLLLLKRGLYYNP